jgi:hypothetical protein
MPAGSRKQKVEPQATFIFKGKLKQLKRATMASVPVDERTAVVSVEQVLAAPEYLADYLGQDITVRLAGRGPLKVGQELIFHATPWMYGDSIAVQSLSQEPATTARAAAVAPAGRQADRDVRARFADADLVVAGRVKEVRLPAGARAAATGRAPVGPISEHHADWREAVIEVADVLKGKHARKNVIVRFPASTDISWHQAPKFHPGQEGYFILHKAEAIKASPQRTTKQTGTRAAVTAPASAEAYTALHPADFQSAQQPGGIEALAQSEAARVKG